MQTLTALETNITDKQIRALRDEALAAGDYQQVDLCQRALTLDSDVTDADENLIPMAEVSQLEARAECERVVLGARDSAIESLRTFALTNGEVAFAHLCTAALAGEEWAVERVTWSLSNIQAVVLDCGPLSAAEFERAQIHAIRATDTARPARPDSAIARSMVAP